MPVALLTRALPCFDWTVYILHAHAAKKKQIITSGVICGIGDILAQALAFKLAATEAVSLGALVAALEFKRFAIYTFLGAVWIAPVVHYWFDALEAGFKDKKAVASPSFAMKMFKALKMVTLDQTIGAPVVNAG